MMLLAPGLGIAFLANGIGWQANDIPGDAVHRLGDAVRQKAAAQSGHKEHDAI